VRAELKRKLGDVGRDVGRSSRRARAPGGAAVAGTTGLTRGARGVETRTREAGMTLTDRARGAESGGARAAEGVGANRWVPPSRESESARAGAGKLGQKVEEEGVAG
jgi:hypothetical protein